MREDIKGRMDRFLFERGDIGSPSVTHPPPKSEGTVRHDWDWGARPNALMQALYAVPRVAGLHGERQAIPRPAASVSITGAAAGTWLTWLR